MIKLMQVMKRGYDKEIGLLKTIMSTQSLTNGIDTTVKFRFGYAGSSPSHDLVLDREGAQDMIVRLAYHVTGFDRENDAKEWTADKAERSRLAQAFLLDILEQWK